MAAVPALLLAAVIVAVGYVAARLVRSLIESALGGIGFDALPGKLNLAFLAGREGQLPPSRLVGGAAAAVIVLITAQQAFASLRLVQLANLVGAIVAYLPHLAVGLVILLAALSLASYLASLVSGAMAHHPHARLLSGVVRYAVILLGASMALEQLNVGREIIMIAVGALAGGSALALGLAFGLGGKDRARSLIDTWTGKPSGGAGPA